MHLEYHKEFHSFHNYYLLATERLTVSKEMFSSDAHSLLNNRKFVGTPKLIPNLNDEQNYVSNYRNLKFYLQLGLKLTAVHESP